MSITVEHPGPWTEEEFLALPESRQQLELLDGGLLVSPLPASDHQQLARRLANLLEEAAPDELEVIEQVNLRVGPGRILGPDLVVTHRHGRVTVFDARDIVLVSEVVSPSTTAKDRLLKAHLYAAAGIPWYLRVEPRTPEPPELNLGQLTGETYAEHGCGDAGSVLDLPEPFEGMLDPAALLKRRGQQRVDARMH